MWRGCSPGRFHLRPSGPRRPSVARAARSLGWKREGLRPRCSRAGGLLQSWNSRTSRRFPWSARSPFVRGALQYREVVQAQIRTRHVPLNALSFESWYGCGFGSGIGCGSGCGCGHCYGCGSGYRIRIAAINPTAIIVLVARFQATLAPRAGMGTGCSVSPAVHWRGL